jgi:tRNA pseudouridine13 synthase
LKRKQGAVGYAGMKDKCGITAQFCTLYRTKPQQIISQFQNGGGGNTKGKGCSVVQVGNFQYVSKAMRLGTLKGNHFDVIFRNVQMGNTVNKEVNKQALEAAAKAMKEKGFINYFGTQHFGKHKDTHLVGIAVLQGNFCKAVDIIMEPKQDNQPDAEKAQKEWQDRFHNGETAENKVACAKHIMRGLNRFMTAKNSIVQSLVVGGDCRKLRIRPMDCDYDIKE